MEEDAENNKRVQRVLKEVRARAGDLKDANGNVIVRKQEWSKMRVHVVSKNNFPTAAGLASSAAGYAALAFALGKLHGVVEKYEGELSTLGASDRARRPARYGGSSRGIWARRLRLGFKARQVAPASHWPELKVLILVVSDTKKAVSSTAGMQMVETSPLPPRCDGRAAADARHGGSVPRQGLHEIRHASDAGQQPVPPPASTPSRPSST